MPFSLKITKTREIIRGLLITLLSVLSAYFIHRVFDLPFRFQALIVSILVPALLMPLFIFLNYRTKKRLLDMKHVLEVSNKKQALLIREINHRVANNYSIILSLLNLQKSTPNCKDDVDSMLQIFERRIRSMSLIYEIILNSPDSSTMDLKSFIEEMIGLFTGTGSNPFIKIDYEVKPQLITVNLNDAMAVGLILSELICNSYTHAFPKDTEGRIVIRAFQVDRITKLVVEDDGIGIPPQFLVDSKDTLGLYLVRTLSEQLKGQYSFQVNQGTKYTLEYKGGSDIESDTNHLRLEVDKGVKLKL